MTWMTRSITGRLVSKMLPVVEANAMKKVCVPVQISREACQATSGPWGPTGKYNITTLTICVDFGTQELTVDKKATGCV